MRIGIVAQEHGEVFGVHQDYMTLAENFGTPVVISPVDKNLWFATYGLDGLILPGGSDINPRRYKHMISYSSYRPNHYLEFFDTEILPEILRIVDFPIFGICRGLQTLNVAFGGTLHQHLWRHPYSKEKTELIHKIYIKNLEGEEAYVDYSVNSFHHQAIANLAEGFEAIAISEDGIIEAIVHKTSPISAVQWHPERIMDDLSVSLMQKIFV